MDCTAFNKQKIILTGKDFNIKLIKQKKIMKTRLFFTALCLSITFLLSAQLKVDSNGNVGIQLGTSTPLSALSIGNVGTTNDKVTIYGLNTALNVYRTGSSLANWSYGANSTSDLTGLISCGLRGQAYASTLQNAGRAWGVLGFAGNSTSGYNYGVMGIHAGTGYGAGVVGTVNGNSAVVVPGIYAGYFVGDVIVTGTLTGNPVVNSDKRYKKNIIDLDTKKTLNNVLQMLPVEYNLNQIYTKSVGDSAVVERGLYDEKSQVFLKKHYGLIAQDLQKLYPDLVYEDNNGYLSVNYIGIIPLLIQSIKELKAEVETLSPGNANPSAPSKASAIIPTPDISETNTLTYPVLEQNIPNPFNAATSIGFSVPTTVVKANIYVYDMNGVQLKSFAISERGKGTVTIQGSEFIAGMYLYALIADGKVFDTKRMILTK
jgi:hypothetical protein